MKGERGFGCVSIGLILAAVNVHAQFTDPRMYTNSPVGMNQVELAYAYAHSDASIDTSLIIGGAALNLNQGLLQYARYFSFVHNLAWAEAAVPIAGLGGSVTGTTIHGSVTGTGDSSYQFGTLLKGGPALSVGQFATYKPVTTVGASLTVTAPTGLYNADKLLNLGSNRWSFKPEIALSHPFGPEQKWEFDAYANAYLYTDNTDSQGGQTLRQRALAGIEGHVSYSFNSNVWASIDTRYAFGGDTFLNGLNQNNTQQNFIVGNEINISLNSRNSVVLVLEKALIHKNGPSGAGLAVRYFYTWGKGDK